MTASDLRDAYLGTSPASGVLSTAMLNSAVLAAYREGVSAIEQYSAKIEAVGAWTAVASGRWTAVDLAGHLLIIAGWYQEWLERALRGDPRRPFLMSNLDARNEAALSELPDGSGPNRIAAYAMTARAYADRLPNVWNIPYGFPGGITTAGLHAAVAAVEWHVHAWDLSRVIGEAHHPSDPQILVTFASTALVVGRTPGPLKPVVKRLMPSIARLQRRPWQAILHRMGRAQT